MNPGPVRLLHLSDIHFSKASGGAFDLDVDLRNEVELDVERLHAKLGPMTGILVTGDIAFAGQQEEYETAHKWLASLASRAGCLEQWVWTVPGNHDVDRATIRSSHMLKTSHSEIRATPPHELDDRLARWATDPHAAPVLLAPLSHYNAFAQSYECDVKVDELHWDDDLTLNDGSKLRIRGVTSSLISDDLDDDREHRLVVGRMQLAMPREDGVEYLLMCHHPPDWLLDRDSAEDFLKRARIQLFGHKHRQRLTMIDQSLRLSAGAVHPVRTDPEWVPRYNVLEIGVDGENDKRRLAINVYPRVWSEADTCFIPESPLEKRSHLLTLPLWQPDPTPSAMPSSTPDHGPVEPAEVARSSPPGALVDANRRLVYRFCELPYLARIDIARDLGLLADEDQGITDLELNRRILRRARERAQLPSLWSAVEGRYPDPAPSNPFTAL